MIEYRCDRCGKQITPPAIRYSLKIELFAAREKIFFTEAELQKDHRAEMERLIHQMETMDPDELNDQVYKYYEYDLCNHCRNELYHFFKKPLPLQSFQTADKFS